MGKALSLSDVLQFGSGSRFPNFQGCLVFDHDCVNAHQRISGNTCAFTIRIPVNDRYVKCNIEQFALKVMEDMFEDYGFGQK